MPNEIFYECWPTLNSLRVFRKSPLTGKESFLFLRITEEQLVAWAEGRAGNVQDAFPHLSADEREFLMTGYTADDWKAIFGEPEEPTVMITDEMRGFDVIDPHFEQNS